MTAGATLLLQDLPPYVMAAGNAAKPFGINAEGLKRRGFTDEQVTEIRRAYKTLYRSGLTLEEAKGAIAAQAADVPALKIFVEFLGRSTRGIVR
jgi:UDP-N-acetylglucosamine acyltransferase